MDPIYPDITVQLTGEDGNAFSIIGRVSTVMRRAAIPKEKIDAFRTEAMSGDYNGVLQTAMKYVNVE